MIKRYDLTKDELQEVEDGAWVRYDDHEAEVERLRTENERMKSRLRNLDSIGVEALRKAGHPNPDEWGIAFAVGWLENRRSADRDERLADAIYAAVFANSYLHVGADVAMVHAEDAVEAWREAQKGGDDG